MSADLDITAAATEIVYKAQVIGNSYPEMPGYRVDHVFDDLWDNTGFYAVGFKDEDAGDVLIAIRGSQDRLDVVTNAALGVSQYKANREPLLEYIGQNILGHDITIAGHSLGGGLSQYLGYDAALTYPAFRDKLTVQTQNGFGGIIGIARMHGAYDPSVIEGVTFRNYRHPDDPVSRLGGQVGGIFNLADPDPLPNLVFFAHSNDRFLKKSDGRSPFPDAVAAEDDAFDISQTLEELGPRLSEALRAIVYNENPLAAIRRITRLFTLVPENERDSFYSLVRDVAPMSRFLQRVRRRRPKIDESDPRLR
jgi:hypothetical protein